MTFSLTGGNRTCDDIPGSQLIGKVSPGFVNEASTRTTDGFTDQGATARAGPGIKGRRMKLGEFHIDEICTGTGCDGQSGAGAAYGAGGSGIECAYTAARDHTPPGGNESMICPDTMKFIIFGVQTGENRVFKYCDARCVSHARSESFHDRGSAGITVSIDDAMAGMGCLKMKREISTGSPCERNVPVQKSFDSLRTGGSYLADNLRIAETDPGGECVGCVQFRRVIGADCRCQPALSEAAGSVFSERSAGKKNTGMFQMQSGRKSGQAGSGYDGPARVSGEGSHFYTSLTVNPFSGGQHSLNCLARARLEMFRNRHGCFHRFQ